MNAPHNRPDWSRLNRQDLADRSPTWPTEKPLTSVQDFAAALAGEELAEAVADFVWNEADRAERQAQARQYRGLGAGDPGA